MKGLVALTISLFCLSFFGISQQSQLVGGPSYSSFIDYQKSFQHFDEAELHKEDTLQKQFAAKGLKWPAKYVYIRSFKYDSELEVWVKNEIKEPFKLFKTYKICALAGTLGPKRMEGDYQVPEGFYYIDEFNPKSTYYLSLGLNYPNASDKILSDSLLPGSDIYIHGSCVTVGCIPITDQQIDEVYILAAHAKDQGQDFIPVHIFPVRYNVPRSVAYLDNLAKDDPSLKKFASRLEDAFDYFEKYHQLPIVMIDAKGQYIINGAPAKNSFSSVTKVNGTSKQNHVQHRVRNITGLAETSDQWPLYPGGGPAFSKWLDQLGKEMVNYLPKGIHKVYAQVEFIIDRDGMPVNFKVIRGTKDEDFIDELITHMEKMPSWQPATTNNKPVPRKLIQTVSVEAF